MHKYTCMQVVNSVARCNSSTQDNTALSLCISDGRVDLSLLESFLGSREPARAVVTLLRKGRFQLRCSLLPFSGIDSVLLWASGSPAPLL